MQREHSGGTSPANRAIQTPPIIDLSLILRGLFATAVVWWHVIGYKADNPLPEIFTISGRLSVWMFFGLSGYVIGYGFFTGRYAFTGNGQLLYFLRRALRILPLFWIASLIAVSILFMRGTPFSEIAFKFPTQFFAIQWSHLDYAVGVFWTLGVEIQFYALAPIIAFAMLKPNAKSLLIGIFFWCLLWLVFGSGADDRSLVGNLQHFIAGMVVARAYVGGGLDRLLSLKHFTLWTVLVGALLICASNWLYHQGKFWSYQSTIVADLAIVSLLLAHCGIERVAAVAGVVGRCFMTLGVLAYGLYAWHGVLLTFWPFFHDQLIITFVTSLLLAYLSFKLLEKPIIDLGYRHGLPVKPSASARM